MKYKSKKGTRCRTLRKFAAEEASASKDYRERGFNEQASDEKKHSSFFGNLFRKRCR